MSVAQQTLVDLQALVGKLDFLASQLVAQGANPHLGKNRHGQCHPAHVVGLGLRLGGAVERGQLQQAQQVHRHLQAGFRPAAVVEELVGVVLVAVIQADVRP
ncbi:hypothetical protein D3C75_1091570 [compost metagenome]